MLGAIALLALATATTTVTLCKAKVTQRLREVLSRVEFLKEMLSCLYCTSHWVGGAFALSGPMLGLGSFVDWLVTAGAVICLAAPAMWLINRSHGGMIWE